MDVLEPYVPRIREGLLVSVEVTLMAMCVAGVLAFALGIARLSDRRLVRLGAGGVIEFFRGTSALVQLFWVFFALPLLPGELQLTPMVAAVAVLGLNEGAYAAEVVRGAIVALPQGQSDAAHALHLAWWPRLRRVVLPQAVPMMLPGFGNAAVDLLKASAFVGFVQVHDLTYWSDQIRLSTGASLEAYLLALVLYFLLALALSGFFRLLEALTPLRRLERRRGRRLVGSSGSGPQLEVTR
jgi:polar amino acid transport system permease protein